MKNKIEINIYYLYWRKCR